MTLQVHEFSGGTLLHFNQVGDLENGKFITTNSERYQKT